MAVGKTLVRLFFSHSRMLLSLALLYHHHRRINMGEISSHPTWRNELYFSRAKRQNANTLPVLQHPLQLPKQ
jgi:hypothetical protein